MPIDSAGKAWRNLASSPFPGIAMKHRCFRRIAAAFAVLVASSTAPAFAEYVWLDNTGVKQYSDMPPPSSVPPERILKQPGGIPHPADSHSTAAQMDTPETAKKAPPTIAEQNAEFRKRRAEREEQEKKAAEQARIAADKAKNCERARVYHSTLASGQRVVTTGQDGERSYLSDDQRARELRDVTDMLKDCR
jgi:hypothetical protein